MEKESGHIVIQIHAPPINESIDLHGVAHIMRNYFVFGRKTQLRSHTSHGAWALPLPKYLGLGNCSPTLVCTTRSIPQRSIIEHGL